MLIPPVTEVALFTLLVLTLSRGLSRVKLTDKLKKSLLSPGLDGFVVSSVDHNPRHVLVLWGLHASFLSHPVFKSISLSTLGASFKGGEVKLGMVSDTIPYCFFRFCGLHAADDGQIGCGIKVQIFDYANLN